MGGFRNDGKLLESLQRAVEKLFECGFDTLSDDVEEAIERLRPIYTLTNRTFYPDGEPPVRVKGVVHVTRELLGDERAFCHLVTVQILSMLREGSGCVAVRLDELPESEGQSSEAITSMETSGLPARQSGSPGVDPPGERQSREQWLNGWPRLNGGSSVLFGTGIHCAGCGKFFGTTCVSIRDDEIFPDKAPDWPFEEGSCPVCVTSQGFTEQEKRRFDSWPPRTVDLYKRLKECEHDLNALRNAGPKVSKV
jgi:hypothetical protein